MSGFFQLIGLPTIVGLATALFFHVIESLNTTSVEITKLVIQTKIVEFYRGDMDFFSLGFSSA